jgi:hypothetical protein
VAVAVIEREEVIGLFFNVADIAATVDRIKRLLEEDDGEEEAAQAEREASEAEHARVMANVRRTRDLAERAQAKLDAAKGERERAEREGGA